MTYWRTEYGVMIDRMPAEGEHEAGCNAHCWGDSHYLAADASDGGER